MGLTKPQLADDFARLGLQTGDIVLVHSSLSSMGYVEGGADTVIDALLSVIGSDGTLMVPTLTGKETDSPDSPPVFDVRNTPCWTGIIPETVRKRPEAKRSLHPTHSVAAIGAHAAEITRGHENGDSPCDAWSPYFSNHKLNGYILLLGVDQESDTTVHCCEEIAGVPYHLQADVTEVPITDSDGSTIVVRNRLHDWHKPPTDFNRFEPIFRDAGVMTVGKVGDATARLIRAKDMVEFAVEMLRNDPLFLVTS